MAVLRTGFRCYYFPPVWKGTGFDMTRFSAAAVIFGWLAFFSSFPVIAQSDPSQCFPWQEFKNGTCVAKPSQAPPPLPPVEPTSAAPPCFDGTRSLSGQCTCPINMHLEGGRCTADASVSAPAAPAIAPAAIAPPIPPPLPQQATRKPDEPMVCDGGTASNGRCVCPAGYAVMPPLGGGSGGTCVRTDAANCQGGELTVSGTCMCNRPGRHVRRDLFARIYQRQMRAEALPDLDRNARRQMHLGVGGHALRPNPSRKPSRKRPRTPTKTSLTAAAGTAWCAPIPATA